MRGFLLSTWCATALWLTACNGDGKDTPVDDTVTDADADADADADSDADADTDTDSDSDADTDTDADPNVVVDCQASLPAPPAGETCAVVSGDPATATHLLIQGDILADDASYLTGDLLMDRGVNGQITCVGCGCAAPADTLVVSCPDAVVSPGLINSHDHIRYGLESPDDWGTERYDHRHDWRTGARGHTELHASSTSSHEGVLYGELRMMLGGATSIAGSVSPASGAGLLRDLDQAEDNEGLGGWEVGYETFPLGDIDGTMAATGCDAYYIDPPWVLDDRIYLPHIAEGIDDEARNEFLCLSGLQAGGEDLIADNTSIVHGIGLNASDVAEVAASHAQLVWSPRSNVSLYGETAAVVLYDNFGVPIALGTDWTPSGSGTLLRELKCADTMNRDHYGSHFSDRDLWLMVTRNAAVATGSDGQLGRLRPGFIGDVAVFAKRGASLHRAVIDADLPDVVLVLRGSVPMTGDADLLGEMLPAGDFAACEALGSCVSDHVVCMDGGTTLAAVLASVGTAYDLEICGTPPGEPTCEPLRDDEDGDGLIYPTSSLNDLDQDGVDDVDDNCPDVFNPGKPLDGFVQGDVDGDGIGDACDVCPLQAGGGCNHLDPDGDGVKGLDDNCPDVANPTQDDLDQDLLGDACDACPDFYSPTGACPASVYDAKQTLPDGDVVVLEHLIVTAVGPSGMFMQLDPADAAWTGYEYSGIYAYLPGGGLPARGDRITIEGALHDFYGQRQLTQIARWSLEAAGVAEPEPVVVLPSEVATGAALADPLEAVLVQVEDVTVTAVDLPPGSGDVSPTHEFEVDDSLRVNDLVYGIDPEPAVGEQFGRLRGVLRFANDDSKLEPRDAGDVLGGPATVAALVPDAVAIEAGATDATLLTVTLARAAGQDEVVSLVCAPATALTCPATVTVPTGASSAPVALTGVAADAVPATVTASLNGSQAVASVSVYDDATVRALVSLTPNPLNLAPDTVAPLTVTLDLPAPAAGAVVDVVASSGFVTLPATVTVPAGATSASFDVTAGAALGVDLVTATYGASTADAVVNVDPAAVGIGLIVSEYLEGSVGEQQVPGDQERRPARRGPVDLQREAVRQRRDLALDDPPRAGHAALGRAVAAVPQRGDLLDLHPVRPVDGLAHVQRRRRARARVRRRHPGRDRPDRHRPRRLLGHAAAHDQGQRPAARLHHPPGRPRRQRRLRPGGRGGSPVPSTTARSSASTAACRPGGRRSAAQALRCRTTWRVSRRARSVPRLPARPATTGGIHPTAAA
ncbi:MAG: hypothetical protein R3F59_30585 [Myxococcota bacterium]